MSKVVVRRVHGDEGSYIRRARLTVLAEETWREHFLRQEQALGDDAWRARAERGASSDTLATFAALDGDNWIGITDGLREEATTVEVAGMWVHPEHRRQGVGRTLLQAVATWAEERGAARLRLWVVATNEPAIALYTACGFVTTGEAKEAVTVPSLTLQRMEREMCEGVGGDAT